jgi:signal transduction histidine kinase/CheY-like chemotaxis protein
MSVSDERVSHGHQQLGGAASASAGKAFGPEVFMALPSPTALLAPSGIVMEVNAAWRRLTGDDTAADVGCPVWRRFAPAERSHIVGLINRLRETAHETSDGSPVVSGTQIRHTDGHRIDVALRIGTTRDAVRSTGPDLLLAQLEPLPGQQDDTVRRPGTGDRQVALETIARSVSVSTNLARISASVITAVARATGCPLVGLWRRGSRDEEFVLVDGLGFGAGARGTLALEGHREGLAAHTIRTRGVVAIGGPTGTAARLPHALTERGVSSGVAIPLHGIAGGDGLLTVSATHNQPMDPDVIRFLAIVGDLLTMALHREGVDQLIAGERRRTAAVAHDLEQLERRYRLTVDMADIRDWCWCKPVAVTTDRRIEPPPRWSVQICLDSGPQAIADCAIAEDLDEYARAVNAALADDDGLNATVRVRTTEGLVTVHLRGMIERDDSGDVVQVHGVAMITPPPDNAPVVASRDAQERLARLAHDLNNLLAAMLGTAQQLVDRGADRRQLIAIVHAGRRARELVAGLHGGRDGQHRLAGAYDLADVVGQLRPLLRGLVGKGVRLGFQLQRDARALRPSREEVERILLDLVSNSADAVTDGGRVTIATDTCIQFERMPDPHAPPVGRWARLRVSDNGDGMTASAQDQVFTPGFTTKMGGHHRGLGLATVHRTVTAAGGAIRIDSAPGRGTVIDVYLPLTTQQTVRLQPLRPAPLPRRSPGVGAPAPRIALIAEDEPALRELLQELVSALGFETAVAADGATAVAMAHDLDRLDLVVSDLRMPQLDGLELARQIRTLHAQAAVVLLSGAPPETPVADRTLRILRKPFEWAELREAVRSLIPIDGGATETFEAPSSAASG